MTFLLPWLPFYALAGLFLYGVLRLNKVIAERGRPFLRFLALVPGLAAAGIALLFTQDNGLIVSTAGAAGACFGAGGALFLDNFLQRRHQPREAASAAPNTKPPASAAKTTPL